MRLTTMFAALALSCSSCSPALSADLDHGLGGMKDGHYARPLGGFGVRLFMGYGWGDRSVRQDNDYEAGLAYTLPEGTTGATVLDNGPDGAPGTADDVTVDGVANEISAIANAHGLDTSWDGQTFTLPLLRTLLGAGGDVEIGSFVGGGEIEYIGYAGRVGLGVVAGATFYGDADSRTVYTDRESRFGGGTLITPNDIPAHADGADAHPAIPCPGATCAGDPTGILSSGFVEAERSVDIDLAVKFGYLLTERTLVYGVAGPSFARATVTAATDYAGIGSYSEEQWALGFVVGGGIQHHFADGWSLGLQADYKRHTFEAEKGARDSANIAAGDWGSLDAYQEASSKSEVEDSVWTVKAGVAKHF